MHIEKGITLRNIDSGGHWTVVDMTMGQVRLTDDTGQADLQRTVEQVREQFEELDTPSAREWRYATEINRLRNVIQSACIGGMAAMSKRWAELFPDDNPLPVATAEPRVQAIMKAADEFGHVYAYVGDDTMPRYRQALEDLVRLHVGPVPAGWELLPEDLGTHLNDWRTACRAMAAIYATDRGDDNSYWKHQLDTLDRIEELLRTHRPVAQPPALAAPYGSDSNALDVAGRLVAEFSGGKMPRSELAWMQEAFYTLQRLALDAALFTMLAESVLNHEGEAAAYLMAAGRPDSTEGLRTLLAAYAAHKSNAPAVDADGFQDVTQQRTQGTVYYNGRTVPLRVRCGSEFDHVFTIDKTPVPGVGNEYVVPPGACYRADGHGAFHMSEKEATS